MNPPSISRSTSTQSIHSATQANSQQAALQGATSAFGKPPARPKPAPRGFSGVNGAFAAATAAEAARKTGMTGSALPSNTLGRQTTGSSIASLASPLSMRPVEMQRMPSTSSVAAGLAVARSPQPREKSPATGPVQDREQKEVLPQAGTVGSVRTLFERAGGKGTSAPSTQPKRVDTVRPTTTSDKNDITSIPPTSSLVGMFENRQPAEKKSEPVNTPLQQPIDKPIVSPKPVRKFSVASIAGPDVSAQTHPDSSSPTSSASAPKQKDQAGVPPLPKRTSEKSVLSEGRTLGLRERRLSGEPRPSSVASLPNPSPARTQSLKPEPPPPRRVRPPTTLDRRLDLKDTTTNQVRSTTSSPGPSHPRQALNPYQQASLRQLAPHITGDSLANAIVASSLASSRAQSPTKFSTSPPPPLLPQRPPQHQHHKHHLHLHSPHHHEQRNPSPSRTGMRTTMRKLPSSDSNSSSDEARRKKKRNIVRKHPNKHHEGDRKRWRDHITDRQRRRYEGVWAANKGLHIPYSFAELEAIKTEHEIAVKAAARKPLEEVYETPLEVQAKSMVGNLVVRDIWRRSRLPDHVLEEVWNLVDGSGTGRLTKEEFVVGMWLIDQRLKGKKLPAKVSESVWASVRGLQGVKPFMKKG